MATGSVIQENDAQLSLTQARGIVKDLFTPREWIYWTDFLLTYALGYVCLMLCRRVVAPMSWEYFAAFLVQCLAFYRCSLFIHELVHIRSGSMRAFRFVWNLLCGIPFLLPSFTYYTHSDHHRRKYFGTQRDGEYLPLGHRPRWHVLMYLSHVLVIPPLAVFRFLVLSPLTWVSPTIRHLAHRHASSIVIDPSYLRPEPTKQTLRTIRLQEFGCFIYILVTAYLVFSKSVPPGFLQHVYATAIVIVGINALRTFGSHNWTGAGEEMSFSEQFHDSVNYPNRPWVSELWGPVGTRYHALHHLFPSLPYHSLGKAHRRLMAQLPAESPYRETVRGGLLSVLWDLWRRDRPVEKSELRLHVFERRREAGRSWGSLRLSMRRDESSSRESVYQGAHDKS